MNKYLIAVGFNQNGFQQVEVQRLHTGSGTAFHLWHAFEDSSAEWLREPCINSTTDFGKLSSSARPSTSCLDSLFCTINWTRSPTILLDGVTDWPPCKLFWRPRTGCPVLANRPGTGGSCTGRRGSRWGRRRRCPISSWRNTRTERTTSASVPSKRSSRWPTQGRCTCPAPILEDWPQWRPSTASWSSSTWNRRPRPPHRRQPGQRPTWKPLRPQKCRGCGRGWARPDGVGGFRQSHAARGFNSPAISLMLTLDCGDLGDYVGRLEIGAQRGELPVDEDVADVVQQLLRPVLWCHKLEQFGVLGDEVSLALALGFLTCCRLKNKNRISTAETEKERDLKNAQ